MNLSLNLPGNYSKVVAIAAIVALLGPVMMQFHKHITTISPQSKQGSWPAIVTGVAANDRLNIRISPGVGNAILDTIPYNGTGVAVWQCTNTEGRASWCEVSYGRTKGWAKRKFLKETQ